MLNFIEKGVFPKLEDLQTKTWETEVVNKFNELLTFMPHKHYKVHKFYSVIRIKNRSDSNNLHHLKRGDRYRTCLLFHAEENKLSKPKKEGKLSMRKKASVFFMPHKKIIARDKMRKNFKSDEESILNDNDNFDNKTDNKTTKTTRVTKPFNENPYTVNQGGK